ncbi:MAG TPA: stage IV sporulation protein A, partial [Clostridiales bacterium]|nr:stage IV sporulation protein A [Clostridiales bacterium]
EQPRMVKTPWSDEELPFNVAAEMGTHKVIAEHSTIGLVVTTDGSISDIPRYEYEEAEERVIKELQEINKPFIVLLNCMYPQSASARSLADELSEKYQVPVVPVNCIELSENEIVAVLTQVLYEFPVKEIEVELPAWLSSLNSDHWLKSSVFGQIKTSASKLTNMRTVTYLSEEIAEMENISGANIESMSLGTGRAHIKVTMSNVLFYKVIEELTKIKIENEQDLMKTLTDLSMVKVKYERLKDALDEVEATGYGIVMPTIDELKLEEPEIMKQGGKYGVRLKASAPSVHMLRADITTEVAPIVGSESQSEELVKYLLQGFEEDPQKIWESNIFGKSLHELVNEGLKNKLFHMPADARMKLQETLERIINEGCSGLICIIL